MTRPPLLHLFSDPESLPSVSRNEWVAVGMIGTGVLLFLASTVLTGSSVLPSGAQPAQHARQAPAAMERDTTIEHGVPITGASTLDLRDLPSHPANKLSPYFPPGASHPAVANPSVLQKFHDVLEQFAERQAVDDNFTVRVIDSRSHTLLELYEFEDLRARYQQGESVAWETVDRRRREITGTLVDKYQQAGIPLEDITVRWGRANQIEEAQARNRPYRAYEIQLARALGLSLLATQIGTVETFNRDDLVSTSGAQSRYQMLPWILRHSGVKNYTLSASGYGRVEVEEALHPLLTLEPAYLLLRGYVNAVGHEIPGLSAYHTGPGNIFKLYREYYTSSHYNTSSTVADAYIWAVTEGYEQVSDETSFGPFSRGYVPSAYGALVAKEDAPVDLSQSMQAVRVQLKSSAEISLKRILTTLDTSSYALDWHPMADRPSIYDRFRAFNPHFDLPPSRNGDVPAAGNVHLVSSQGGDPVRFFLPIGAPTALKAAGLNVIDPTRSFSFDDSTYPVPSQSQKTVWDRRYSALVDRIKHFGFTLENRRQLLRLHDKFEALADANPTRYRKRQLAVIRTHRRLWLSEPWETLSAITTQIAARTKLPIEPPVELRSTEAEDDSLFGRLVP